jgi:branched-chain amino acid transport system substrate-binding protein
VPLTSNEHTTIETDGGHKVKPTKQAGKRIGIAGVAMLILLMLTVLAGCGSSSSSSTSSASTETTPAAEAPAEETETAASGGEEAAGQPIVVGSICSCSGPLSSTTAAVPEAMTAWEKWTNAHGGINGHPVKVILKDDGLDAATTAKAAKELVKQDHVMAIVGETSNLDGLWEEEMKSEGIPVVGAALFNTAYESNPVFFPTGAQNPTEVFGIIQHAKETGNNKIGVLYCAESPSCATYAKLFEEEGKIVGGVELVLNQKITATEPNYTAPCLAAQEAGANTFVVLQASTVVVSVAEDCGQQGYEPAGANLSFTPGTDWATNPYLQGMLSVVPNQSLWDESSPATKEFQEALNEYAPGIQENPAYNPDNASVWAAGQVFKLAGERAKLTPSSTPSDVMKGLYTFKEETLEGLTAPLTYEKGKPTKLVSCYFVSEVKNEEWIAPDGAEPRCIPKQYISQIEGLMTR